MASTKMETTSDGKRYYRIRVRRGRDQSALQTRWYVPDGWSERAIQRELTKVAAEFERQVKAGEIISNKEKSEKAAAEAEEQAKIKTFRQYVELIYTPSRRAMGRAASTLYKDKGIFENHVFPVIGNIKLPDITPIQIKKLLNDMQAEKFGIRILLQVYTLINSVLKDALMDDTIEKNPMLKVPRPKPRNDEGKEEKFEFFSMDELNTILSCADKEPLKWRTLIYLLSFTGMRIGEALALVWQKIDLKNKLITVDGSLTCIPGQKASRETTKNGKERIIPLPDVVIPLLKGMKAEKHIEHFDKDVPAYVFTQKDSLEPMHHDSAKTFFYRFGRKYGINDCHPHKLRHTYATMLLESGTDMATARDLLGHADFRMLSHYTHSEIKNRIQAVQNLEAMLGS